MAASMRRNDVPSLLHPRRLLSTATALCSSPPSRPSPPSTPISRLKSALRAESDPDKILSLFQSSAHLPRFHAHRPVYQISVHKLARSRRNDLIELLLESQKFDPAAPKSEGFFIRIMSLYTNASMPDHAARTFEQIPSRTERSLCALLTAYRRQRRFDRVREIFDRVPGECGIIAGVAAHNILLASLCETSEMDTARQLLEEMPTKKGLEPDIISYNTVLKGCLKNGDKDGFEEIVKEINSKGIAPNVVTYNLRMADFCERMESFKAEELLDVMIAKGISPILSSFNTVIDGFCKEGDSDSAIRVFKRMKTMKGAKGGEGVFPNADTYMALVRVLVSKGEFSAAQSICRESLIRGFAPPFEIMKSLISGLVKESKAAEAKDLVEKMRRAAKGDAFESWKKIEAELNL